MSLTKQTCFLTPSLYQVPCIKIKFRSPHKYKQKYASSQDLIVDKGGSKGGRRLLSSEPPPPFVLIGKKILFYMNIRNSKIYITIKIVFTNKIVKDMLNIFCNLCQLLISSCPLKSRFFTPTLLRDVMISGSNDDHVSYLQAPEKYS